MSTRIAAAIAFQKKPATGGRENYIAISITYWPADEHYATRRQARRSIFAHIEGYYNRTRRHFSIGCISRIEMELKAA
jgi:transposase InsO family protein